MPEEVTSEELESLITDPVFLRLREDERRPNIFKTVAVSHTERWHSAFVKWILDPSSHLGLGDFPLKRFLHTVLGEREDKDPMSGMNSTDAEPTLLSFSKIESMDLKEMIFEIEFNVKVVHNPSMGRGNALIDIYGGFPEQEDTSIERVLPLQIVIENKIYAKEHADQTATYYQWARQQADQEGYENTVCIFLTPDPKQTPQEQNFILLTYQRFCDQVLWPIRRHPALPEESRYLIDQYLLNLNNRNSRGKAMAMVNKKDCKELYDKYKTVFNQIFLAARNGSLSRIAMGKGCAPTPRRSPISSKTGRFTQQQHCLLFSRKKPIGLHSSAQTTAYKYNSTTAQEGVTFLRAPQPRPQPDLRQ